MTMGKRVRLRNETIWPKKPHRSSNAILKQIFQLLPRSLDEQIELSRVSGVGHSTVRNWLKGTRNPTYNTLEALVNALGYELTMVQKACNDD